MAIARTAEIPQILPFSLRQNFRKCFWYGVLFPADERGESAQMTCPTQPLRCDTQDLLSNSSGHNHFSV
eukprot:3775682-Amphidinium_carterae.1